MAVMSIFNGSNMDHKTKHIYYWVQRGSSAGPLLLLVQLIFRHSCWPNTFIYFSIILWKPIKSWRLIQLLFQTYKKLEDIIRSMDGDKNQPVLEAFPDITTSLADQESYCVLSLVLSFFRPTSGPAALLPLASILVPGCWVNPFIPLGGFFLHSTPSTNFSVLHFHCCLKC